MIAGCYVLDLYCDKESRQHEFHEFPHQYHEEHGSTRRRMARKDGWILSKDGTAICPKCSGKTQLRRGKNE